MTADRLFGIFLLLLGAYIFYGGLNIEVPFAYDPLGPSAFPIGMGAILFVLSLFVIAKPKEAHFPNLNTKLKTVAIVVLLVIYQGIFDYIGFIISTIFLVYTISTIFKGTPKQALASAVGVSVSVYLLFKFILEVPLPTGELIAPLLGA